MALKGGNKVDLWKMLGTREEGNKPGGKRVGSKKGYSLRILLA
jgi:hypothetical protein